MKFGKSLNNQIEDALPEWRDKFLSYKELKKKLKLIGAAKSGEEKPAKRQRLDESSNESAALTPEEREFIRLLDDELEKFNGFFVEKEEEYIIRQKLLQERVEKVKHSNKEEMIKVRREIVDFHGEMVLLENYSALNYTGLVKILKKYDKRTGGLMRLPFIQRVLQQPFFTTDLLYKLVKESERMLDQLFPADEPSTSAAEPEPVTADGNSVPDTKPLLKEARELEDIEYMESLYMKSTMAALRALKEIRSGSSTVSVFSLPPLQQNNGPEESWSKIPYLEQIKVAK